MTLVAMVYYVMLAQCVVLTMLCLPYVRNVITWFGRYIPVNTVKWYILLAIGIVAFMSEEALRKMYKLQTQMKELDPSDPHYLEQKEALTPNLLRAQRDSYICGFALFFCFVVPCVYQMAVELQRAKAGGRVSAPAASPRTSRAAADKDD